MKKYKYSRKDWLDYYEDLEHMHITKEAKEDLLAKESNEEYSQRIMMEQVPNNGNGGGFIATNFKQEDNKECKKAKPFRDYVVGFDNNPTPSPLEIEKIKEMSLPYSDAEITINKLIRNQKKLYQIIKEKL